MPDVPDGLGKLAGVLSEAAWAARQGLDWSEDGEVLCPQGIGKILINYVVTTGKTLLITEISACSAEASALFHCHIVDWTTVEYKFEATAIEGLHETFPQPIAIPSAHQIYVHIFNFEVDTLLFQVVLRGYEV